MIYVFGAKWTDLLSKIQLTLVITDATPTLMYAALLADEL